MHKNHTFYGEMIFLNGICLKTNERNKTKLAALVKGIREGSAEHYVPSPTGVGGGWGHIDFGADPIGVSIGLTLSCLHNIL